MEGYRPAGRWSLYFTFIQQCGLSRPPRHFVTPLHRRGTLFHDGRYKTGAPNGALHCSLLFVLWQKKDNHRRLLDGGYSLPSGIPRNLCYALISAYIAGALRRARNNRTFLTFNRIHNLFRFGKNHRFYTQCQCFRVHAFGRNIKIIGTNLQ